MAKSRIEVDHASFRRYRDYSERQVQIAVGQTAREGAAGVQRMGSPSGYDIQEILSSARSSVSALRSSRGWAALVWLDHPLGVIFEKGSYRKLGARGSSRGRRGSETGNRGVKPQRPLRRALPMIQLRLMANIRRAFRG